MRDPNWQLQRDALIGSAFAVSIVAFIFAAAVVWVRVYHSRGKDLRMPLYFHRILQD